MSKTDAKSVRIPSSPSCDRCRGTLEPTGWMPKPDGSGGLRRLIVFRCLDCGRLYDELWGYREQTGQL